MADFTQKIAEKRFSAKNHKEAYLKATRWVGTHILKKPELARNIVVNYQKVKDNAPTIILEVYARISADAVGKEHCGICKEMASSFFMKEEVDCRWCKIDGYISRMKRIMANKISYCNEKLEESEWEASGEQ